MHRLRPTILCAMISLSAACPTFGVRPATWLHEQPKDFNEGKLDDTVVSSLGEVTLGRQTRVLHELKEQGQVVNAIAGAGDGKFYLATGPKGIIYRVDKDKVSEFATLPDGGTVLSLLFTKDGNLLAGTGGGAQAKIYLIAGNGRSRVFHEPPKAIYIWAMVRGVEGEVYAATGNKGQIFKIEADGSKSKVLCDLKPKNALCMAFAPDGFIYAGTDEDGLVYRVDPVSGQVFVVYDAKEPEISAIVFDAQGNLYASTADAEGARPGRSVADKPGGKPETQKAEGSTGSGIPSLPKTIKSQTASRPATGSSTAPASQPESQGGRFDDEEDSGDDGSTTSPATQQASLLLRGGRPVSGGTPGSKTGGNAIYRIDTDGFVTEVFREPVMILGMAEADGTLYAATGNEGRIYAVTPNADRIVMLAKLEAAQATCLLRLADHRLLIGTANAAKVVELSDRYAAKGTLTSKALDAEQISTWGRIRWNATVPTGTKLSIATRSSNVEDEESEAWEDWSPEMDATYPQFISSASARFLQYRVSFETTVPDASPVLRSVEIFRIQPNRAPQITSVEVLAALDEAKKPTASPKVKMAAGGSGFGGGEEASAPKYNWVVKWNVWDPNADPLTFEVFYRELNAPRWIRIAKDLTEPLHIWDTRTVPDGKYEVRVLAKDSKANPPGTDLSASRVSDMILVDNTPPDVTVDSITPKGRRAVRISFVCHDALSRIAGASYNVDSDEKWIPLAADDNIFDAPSETVTFTVDDLEMGEHRIAIRVEDERGNFRYVSRLVTVGD